ncbi:MAG: hypothetical protein IPK02_13370 [Candidatus Accumulibacter sp.]|jgi:hypothetical protein|uniref:Lasso RiPP family leader peptide-containing protein n=1 Tax=Candidatus Accumulibacter affinis TaxID=2954384 RepID=A0A935W5D8_9PROT|nr:hypothetical protein [Candidatus Accumulibacter affinis]
MKEDTTTSEATAVKPASSRKPYRRPTLQVFGSLQLLTQTKGGSAFDATEERRLDKN